MGAHCRGCCRAEVRHAALAQERADRLVEGELRPYTRAFAARGPVPHRLGLEFRGAGDDLAHGLLPPRDGAVEPQLNHIVDLYNSVLTELLLVEAPLLQGRIVRMDTARAPVLTDLRWRSEDKIPDFIQHVMKAVSQVLGIVDIIKREPPEGRCDPLVLGRESSS